MKKLFLIFLLLLSISVYSYGCALCALQTPTAHVSISFDAKQNTIKSIGIKWELSKEFTKQLYAGYDLNDNKIFEKSEIKEIEQALIDYIEPKEYLLKLSYYDIEDDNLKRVEIDSYNENLTIKNGQIFFNFDINVSIKLKNKRVIRTEFYDDEGYFNFKVLNKKSFEIGNFTIRPNTNLSSAFFEMRKIKDIKKDANKSTQTTTPIKADDKNISKAKTKLHVNIKDALNPQKKQSGFYGYLTNKLNQLTNKIKTLFAKSKDNPLALFTLVLFSFTYGVFHAAIPGHGKMLVGSYFLANGGSYLRAFWLCVKIGVIHVAGAFLLVLVSVYFVRTFLSKLLSDVTFYTTILSSIIILSLGFYLLYKKLTNKDKNYCSSCGHSHHEHSHHKHSHQTNSKQELSLALAAGLIPCPGTVAIFILAFTFGNYLSGFLSAVALAFGMSLVIFVVGVFGNFLHVKTSHTFSSLLNKIEYLGLILLVILGFIMLISTFDFGV